MTCIASDCGLRSVYHLPTARMSAGPQPRKFCTSLVKCRMCVPVRHTLAMAASAAARVLSSLAAEHMASAKIA